MIENSKKDSPKSPAKAVGYCNYKQRPALNLYSFSPPTPETSKPSAYSPSPSSRNNESPRSPTNFPKTSKLNSPVTQLKKSFAPSPVQNAKSQTPERSHNGAILYRSHDQTNVQPVSKQSETYNQGNRNNAFSPTPSFSPSMQPKFVLEAKPSSPSVLHGKLEPCSNYEKPESRRLYKGSPIGSLICFIKKLVI